MDVSTAVANVTVARSSLMYVRCLSFGGSPIFEFLHHSSQCH